MHTETEAWREQEISHRLSNYVWEMCVFHKKFKCMSAEGMLLHVICVMCVCT